MPPQKKPRRLSADIGTGPTGHELIPRALRERKLKNAGFSHKGFLAVEPDARHAANLMENIRAAGARGVAAVIRGRAERLPIKSNSLEELTGVHVFHHFAPPRPNWNLHEMHKLQESYQRSLHEAHRVLKPGGRMEIEQPLNNPATRELQRVVNRLVREGLFEVADEQEFDDFQRMHGADKKVLKLVLRKRD